ncbi:MAG: hypothetical protein R2828_06475 [Saprospiraceae bacterium]
MERRRKIKTAGNSTYPNGGVSCSNDSFVVNQTSVFQIKFFGKSPALRVAAKKQLMIHKSSVLTLLLSGCFFTLGFNQETDFFLYHALINKAEIANVKMNFQQADTLYQAAFLQFGRGFANDFLKAAENATALNDPQKAIAYLETGFKNGLSFGKTKGTPSLVFLKASGLIGALKKRYQPLRKAYLAKLNGELRAQIAAMVKADQKYRSGRFNKLPWKDQQALLRKADDENFATFISICQNDGFPGVDLVGEDDEISLVDVPTLLRHMDSTKLETIRPYVLKAIREGHFRPFDYVTALDYTSMFKTTIDSRDENGNAVLIIQQKYGTMLGRENDKDMIYPVEDLKNINALRRQFGLESIEDYAFKIQCSVPEEGIYKRVFPRS